MGEQRAQPASSSSLKADAPDQQLRSSAPDAEAEPQVKLIKQGLSSGDERDLCGDLTVISRKSRQTVTVRHEKTADQSSVADYPSEFDRETPELIWVKCSHPVVVPTGLEAALKTVGYDVHCGQQAPGKDVASSIIYCPTEEEDVGLEVRFLRALFQDALILVFCADADPECVLAALQAGARGFTWRQPAETICALSKGSEKDVVVTKGLLEALLRERVSHDEDCLSPRQREITFELAITASMSSEGALRLPKKLLEAFVGEVIIA
jgi:hypothetical protein